MHRSSVEKHIISPRAKLSSAITKRTAVMICQWLRLELSATPQRKIIDVPGAYSGRWHANAYLSRHTTGEEPLGLSSKNDKYLQVAGFRQVASSDKLWWLLGPAAVKYALCRLYRQVFAAKYAPMPPARRVMPSCL
jgi:hypothetical protein